MSVKTYTNATQITTHLNSKEIKCKCGCGTMKFDTGLAELVENLMVKINAKHCYVSSGYRCQKHDKNVGGSGSGPHTQGLAVDIRFVDSKGVNIPSKTVVLALEDMGHKKGIAYRCGKSSVYTHIDTKNRKWYGDEYYRPYKTCSSYYTYFGISKSNTTTKVSYTGIYPTIPSRGYFKSGDKGTQVKYLQMLLNWINDSKLSVDGVIGPKTIAGIKPAQKRIGTTQDGKWGKKSNTKAKSYKK